MSEREIRSIQEVADCFTGFPFPSQQFLPPGNGEARVFRGDNLKEGNSEWGDKEKRWEEITPDLQRYQLEAGDVLIGMDGSKVGKNWTMVLESDLPALLGQRVCRIRASELGNQEFLFHVFGSNFFRSYVEKVKTGTSIPHISNEQIRNFCIAIPPLPEQKKIAEILSGIDRVLLSQRNKIRSSEVLRKAIVSKHIESNDHATEESKLGDLLLSIDSGWSPDCPKRSPANESEWSVLKTTSVTWNGFDYQERKALPSNLAPRPELVVEEGDILITRAGPTERTGVVAYAERTAPNTMISDKIIRLRCNSRLIDPLFLAIFLGTDFSQRQMLKGKVGMALSQTNISQQLLKDMTIRFPPLQEQKRISRIVNELQKATNNTQGYIERIENLKHSVSADLLSGRKRVSV